MDALCEYIDQSTLEAMPRPAERLLRLRLMLMEVVPAVEVYRQPDVPNSLEAQVKRLPDWANRRPVSERYPQVDMGALPIEPYISEEFFEAERAKIFGRLWLTLVGIDELWSVDVKSGAVKRHQTPLPEGEELFHVHLRRRDGSVAETYPTHSGGRALRRCGDLAQLTRRPLTLPIGTATDRVAISSWRFSYRA